MTPAIEFRNVSKTFARHTGQVLLRSRVAQWMNGVRADRFYALKRVSFELQTGEGLAVVGANGAGKSTLLSIVAGLTKPDDGTASVNGRVSALLELGAGFHPDLTGAENVRLNASLMGLTRKQTGALYDEIVDFSGVVDFIDEPLRTYSSGMVMRLAFSVAINIDPDILIVDEVLAVGDQVFQAKCFDRINHFRQSGKTLLCVSHSAGMVRELCDRAIWLDRGELIMSGQIQKVLDAYTGHHASARG